MDRYRIPPINPRPGRRYAFLVYAVAMLYLPVVCVTMKAPEMAWVRTDGRRIADDPTLLQQGETDIALCHADLDAGSPTDTARACMGQRGYTFGSEGSGGRRACGVCYRRSTCEYAKQMMLRVRASDRATISADRMLPSKHWAPFETLGPMAVSKQREASFFAGACTARYCGSVG
jgi:hypothetical protein